MVDRSTQNVDLDALPPARKAILIHPVVKSVSKVASVQKDMQWMVSDTFNVCKLLPNNSILTILELMNFVVWHLDSFGHLVCMSALKDNI